MIEVLQDGTVREIPIEDEKALSSLCKHLISHAKKDYVNMSDIASALGINTQSLRNKLSRNRFSLNDLLIIVDMVGASLEIRSSNSSTIKLELSEFLDKSAYDDYTKNRESNRQTVFNEILKMSKNLSPEEMAQLISAYNDNAAEK